MTWTIHPRDADLGRTLDPISGYKALDVAERHNLPSTWVLEGPSRALRTFVPGTGCVLYDDEHQVVSGRVRTIDRLYEYNDDGVLEDKMTIGFIEDSKPMWGRLCYPDPTHEPTSTPSTFDVSHDTRTGTREALILGYVGANIGPAAPITERRLAGLVLPTSSGRGGTTTRKARMDVLGDLVASLAEGWGRVRIVHDESTGTPRLLMVIDDVEDVSENIIFGTPDIAAATGYVTTFGYSISDPEVTDAIAFSAGELTERQVTRLDDAAAKALWGVRMERLVDQRQTDDVDEILDALTEELEEGATPTGVQFTVAQGPDTRYRRDFHVGYKVGVVLPDLPGTVADNTIREVHTHVENGQPSDPQLVVGTPGVELRSTKEAARLNRLLKRMAMIERSR